MPRTLVPPLGQSIRARAKLAFVTAPLPAAGALLLAAMLLLCSAGCMNVRSRDNAREKAIWASDEVWLKHCEPFLNAARKGGSLTARPRLVRLNLIVLQSEGNVLIGIRSHTIWYRAFSHYLTEEGQAFLLHNRHATAEVAAALLRGPRSGDRRKDTYRYTQAMMLLLVLKDEKLLPHVRKVVEAAREDHDGWWFVERYGEYVETALKQGWKIPWGRPVASPTSPRDSVR